MIITSWAAYEAACATSLADTLAQTLTAGAEIGGKAE